MERHASTSTLSEWVRHSYCLLLKMTTVRGTSWKWLELIIVSVRAGGMMCVHEACERANVCMHRDMKGKKSTPCFIEAACSHTAHKITPCELWNVIWHYWKKMRVCVSVCDCTCTCTLHLYCIISFCAHGYCLSGYQWFKKKPATVGSERATSIVENRNVHKAFFKSGLKPHKRLMCSS